MRAVFPIGCVIFVLVMLGGLMMMDDSVSAQMQVRPADNTHWQYARFTVSADLYTFESTDKLVQGDYDKFLLGLGAKDQGKTANISVLSAVGAEGWELVLIDSRGTMWFKRPH